MKYLRKIIILLSMCIIIGGFVIVHITPSRSIRTHLFMIGHPTSAFKENFDINEPQYKMDKYILDDENAMIYRVKYHPIGGIGTANEIYNFKVKKIGFLYFTELYGEG
ncbi:hypothetical protein [Clostridium sp.]|jgi:hypothetical protein|uniref:hypothetical protein n=1 Tax=Clostridium sp. TaxID=1506 RepID=UPI00258E5D6C|nr:hypothetical protein [Clostridium sp.]MDF2506070.1 hypothetical protein [Clostridium sp.]